ncbi:MAG: hypothetical protein BWY69_01755 [Planctomycetes bacterium ADurb.Bin401]|nr:MAG: hypothetical protein BWY69_01755 [Planctomycetes bacterium ADurb.Bin401]
MNYHHFMIKMIANGIFLDYLLVQFHFSFRKIYLVTLQGIMHLFRNAEIIRRTLHHSPSSFYADSVHQQRH